MCEMFIQRSRGLGRLVLLVQEWHFKMTKVLRHEIANFMVFFRSLLAKKPFRAAPVVDQTDPCYDDSRMSHNRLQSLDGAGYRACYLQKLRDVASTAGTAVLSREYWFRPSSGAAQYAPQSGETVEKCKRDMGKKSSLHQAVPSRARITSTCLQAYVDRLPKTEE